MKRGLGAIDVASNPDLLRIAEDVKRSGKPRVLQKGDQALAVVVPVPARIRRTARKLSAEDRAAFLASAGGWQDVDTDKLLEDIYAARRTGDRPPVDL